MSGGIYFWISQEVARTDFGLFFSLYSLLFLCYFLLLKAKISHRLFFLTGLIYHLIVVFALPWLSQDFYRFLWDGWMLQLGDNPYLFTPNQWLENTNEQNLIPKANFLIEEMGQLSASNYTNYPPISQFIYFLASFLAEKSIFYAVLFMKLVLVFSSIITLFFSQKILSLLKLPTHKAYWFFLNPLVIIEGIGNLHFEVLMLAFFVASVYYLMKKNFLWAGVLLGLSVATKLITLVFFIYLLNGVIVGNKKFKFSNYFSASSFQFIGGCLLTIAMSYVYFFDLQMLQNYQESVGLWFSSFEFNASFYYVFRWVGFQMYGYNMIAVLGKIIFVLSAFSLLFFAFQQSSKKQMFAWMFLGFACYLFFSTTVHPWYVTTLIVLGVFTKYYTAILWSFLVMLSYYTYSQPNFQESTWFLFAQYVLVIGLFSYELVDFWKKHKQHLLKA